MLIISTIAITIVMVTIKEVESVKYRNDLKARKAERLLAMEQSLQEEQRQRDAKINAFLLRK